MREPSCNISWREKPISAADDALVRPHRNSLASPARSETPSVAPSPSLEEFVLPAHQDGSEGILLPKNAPGEVMEGDLLR